MINKRILFVASFLVLLFTSTVVSVAQVQYPFQNTDLSEEKRLDNLMSILTIDEKINALSTQLGVPRLGIRNCGHSEGLHGVTYGGPARWGRDDPAFTTCFPQAYGLGETWDTDLIKKVAEFEAYETRFYFQSPKHNRGSIVMRAPNADLGRDIRWGRTEECFGEDAFLAARMTVAFVEGLQGDDPKYWNVASLMKHFLANSNEDGRDSTSSNFDKRLFHEYYGYTFYKGITEGGSRAFMAAYNSYNGVPMTVHPVLQDITVDKWGNDGIICTDGGALKLLIEAHKFHKDDPALATAECIKAGISQFLDTYKPYVYEALERNLITESDIEKVIRKNYKVALKLGLLDNSSENPYSLIGIKDTIPTWTKPETKSFVREVTGKSVVLLKNEKNTLPLDKNKIRKIAIIGPLSNTVISDWYGGTPPYAVTVLDGIKNALGKNVEVLHAESNKMDEAAKIAKEADIAIVVIGNHPYGTAPSWKYSPVPSDGREAVDRKAISLEQEDLAKVVYAANPNTVLVLMSSFPFAINWSQQHLPAILHITHSSQETGNGLADVIFGDINPAGRLTQTWAASIDQLPPMMEYNIREGHTYMYFKHKPLYPFGYGLSYSDFKYSNMNTDKPFFPIDGEITISVDIKNLGKRDGDEVVQLYVKHVDSKVERPVKQLKGFKRVNIKNGENATIALSLKAEDIAYWDEAKDCFVTEKGKIKLMLGASSEDIRLTKDLTVK